jgi:hypothetical protein
VKSDNAEDEDDRQSHDDDRVDLEAGRLIGVQPWNKMLEFVQIYGLSPRHGCRFYTQCRSTVHHICFPASGSVDMWMETYSAWCLSYHRRRRPLCCLVAGWRPSQRGRRRPSCA